MTEKTFLNKVVLVTGAGKGLGRTIALAFARQGAVVAANDISPVNLDETVNRIQAKGGRVKDYVEDIAKHMPVRSLIHTVVEDWGGLDILVNNAAVRPRTPILEVDPWDWQRTLDVNLSGVFYAIQAAALEMRKRGGGVIVNIGASTSWLSTLEGQAAYVASKAALRSLTGAAGRELAAFGIRVNAVFPGLLYSGTGNAPENGKAAQAAEKATDTEADFESIEMKTLEDVAELVLFLCSEGAASINAQGVETDGSLVDC